MRPLTTSLRGSTTAVSHSTPYMRIYIQRPPCACACKPRSSHASGRESTWCWEAARGGSISAPDSRAYTPTRAPGRPCHATHQHATASANCLQPTTRGFSDNRPGPSSERGLRQRGWVCQLCGPPQEWRRIGPPRERWARVMQKANAQGGLIWTQFTKQEQITPDLRLKLFRKLSPPQDPNSSLSLTLACGITGRPRCTSVA